jgi:hypothetical protein
MSQEDHELTEVDARLATFATRTAGVRPRAGFSSRVMQQVAHEPSHTLLALHAPALRFFPLGLLAAALAMVWAVSAHDATTEALAVGYDDVELEW